MGVSSLVMEALQGVEAATSAKMGLGVYNSGHVTADRTLALGHTAQPHSLSHFHHSFGHL